MISKDCTTTVVYWENYLMILEKERMKKLFAPVYEWVKTMK